jgi:hypothetical protein
MLPAGAVLAVTVAAVAAAGHSAATGASPVPAAASLGMWWPAMPLRAMPVLSNAYGAATLRRDVQPGYGLVSLGPVTSAPFNGNMQNSSLLLDGVPIPVAVTGWGVCEATRATNASGGVAPGQPYVSNAVRLPYEQHAFLQEWQVCVCVCACVAACSEHLVDAAVPGPPTAWGTVLCGSVPAALHGHLATTQVQGASQVAFNLDGPFFRQCDVPATGALDGSARLSFPSPCGWGLQLPVDRANFVRSLQVRLCLPAGMRRLIRVRAIFMCVLGGP